MKLKVTHLVISALLLVNSALSESRVPLPDDQIILPDYYGVFVIDGGKPLELTKPMDDFNSEPNFEASPMAEFVFNNAGPEPRLIRILSHEEYNRKIQRRKAMADAPFTWENFMALSDMQFADFVKSMSGLFANEEEVELMNKFVEGKPHMVRKIPGAALELGDFRIGDGLRWYKIRVVSSPTRETNQPAVPAEITYESVNYKKLASPTFINDYDNKRVQFDAKFISEYTDVIVYAQSRISTSGKVFISHRHVDYKATTFGMDLTDYETPPFVVSIPKDRADIVFELNRGDIISVRGLAKRYDGGDGMDPGLEILAEIIEVKK